jgi:hypothetical protein
LFLVGNNWLINFYIFFFSRKEAKALVLLRRRLRFIEECFPNRTTVP